MESQRTVERAAQAILIVEEDEAIRRILDLSLRHAGFAVGLASSNEEAIRRLADGPDLVIAGASDADGLAFCRRVKQTGERLPPAVVLISDPDLESKTRGLEAGADDFVVKPIYVQEVVARARALLQRRERERLELSAHAADPVAAAATGGEAGDSAAAPLPQQGDRFVSDIADVPLVDLLRAIAAHQKSGVAAITADTGARGEIFFRQGNVVDGEVGRLSGRDAIYRLFCWTAGRLEVEWKSIRRKDTIEMRPQELLMEALRRVDEWRRLLAGLPPLDTIFEVDYRTLAEQLADIPDEVNRILRLFDGVRTFLQVIDDCGLPDLDAAAAIGKLCHQRIIRDARFAIGEEEAASADMEGWLSEATGPFRSPTRQERELFGASPEAGTGVHGRPTAPLDPLGDGAADPLDEDQRARFTDRLQTEGHAEAQPPEVAAGLEAPSLSEAPDDQQSLPLPPPSTGSPRTLQGFGAAAPDLPRAPAVMPVVLGELETSIEAAAHQEEAAADAEETTALSEPPPLNADEGILSAEDATPIISPAGLDEVPRAAAPEPPTLVAAALPTVPETRSASGEIVVLPSRAKKLKHSPAAEVRLAHLREESARSYLRPSQSVTPPGSARALDEPPPLLDSAPPEPPPRATTELVRATAVERAVEEADEEGQGRSRRQGLLIAGAAALVVLGLGGWFFSSSRQAKDESAAENAAPAPPSAVASPGVVPLGTAPANAASTIATVGASGGVKASPAVQHTAAGAPVHDELEEWNADPKLARARASEAPGLLVACRTASVEQRMKDAEAACTAARDANPNSAEANGYLARALFNRNRRRESLAAAERAVKLNPKLADAYVVIGGIHQDAGEMADAKRAYQRYLEIDPHGQFAGDLRAIVDRLGKL
ncbi:MAG TPA: DUF4388 domain-containing protein [Polyangia bacterium]|nr:DUF4388 domain-containing protein [Polyangia bacterium]